MKIKIPLCPRQAGPIDCPRPEVTIRVRTRHGDFIPLRFIVDSAADLTTIPVPTAERDGIPFRRSNQGIVRGLVGVASKFLDSLHLLIAGVEYEWPCDFLEPPHLPSSVSAVPLSGRTPDAVPVLGRAGFTTAFNFCMDDEYLILTRPSAFHRWWRRHWREFWSMFFPDRSADDPL